MKKTIWIIIASIITIVLVILLGLYVGDINTRNWIDKNILKKDVEEEDLPTIELENRKDYKYYFLWELCCNSCR